MGRRTQFREPVGRGDEAGQPVEQFLQPCCAVTGGQIFDALREVAIEPEGAMLADGLKGVDFGTACGEDRLHHEAVLQVELHSHAVVFAADRPHRCMDPGDLALENIANKIGVMGCQIEQRATTRSTQGTPRARIAGRDRESCADRDERADAVVLELAAQLPDQWMKAVVEARHGDNASASPGRNNLARGFQTNGDWLLQIDVPAAPECLAGHFSVDVARGCDDHGVGIHGIEHLVLRTEESAAGCSFSRGIQGLLPDIRGRYQANAGQATEDRNMDVTRNAATARDGELEGVNR